MKLLDDCVDKFVVRSSVQVDVRLSLGKAFSGYTRELSYEVSQYLVFHPKDERGHISDLQSSSSTSFMRGLYFDDLELRRKRIGLGVVSQAGNELSGLDFRLYEKSRSCGAA